MSSIIEGYNYDIFISYRQKDNKGDRWVSEFVEALKTELESTFKEEISVYFDINPHDGLLETHDVNASLKEKLKCLVFIPIISRTYCDPKSFAWEHEFKTFVEQASKDQFGLKVKLPNGNVASRVLPVRIHDLDMVDIKLCESILESAVRGIEFIYKEPGVNRPLRVKEDNPHDNLNHTIYRNQVNKVANAIKEVITAIEPQEQIPEAVLKESVKSLSNPRKNHKVSVFAISMIAMALTILGLFFIPNLFKSDDQVTKSIAVLPFKSLSDDPDKQYLADGMMDAILLHLSKIKELRVMSRTSVEQYRETDKTLKVIGKELDVAYLLEGSFQKFGDNARLIVQLIKTGKEGHVWANNYDRNWSDIFQVQSEVAQKIADELHTAITPEEKQLIEKIPTKNLTAYDLYQRGREEQLKYWLNNSKIESLKEAEKLFHRTIKLDSTFAQAYAGLAMIYWDKHYWETIMSKDFLDSVLILSNTALSYNNQLSDAYLVRGNYYGAYNKSKQAKEEYDKAINLNPNDFQTYYALGKITFESDCIKSLEYFQKAASLERGELLPKILRSISLVFAEAGFPEKAKSYLHEAFNIDHDSLLLNSYMSRIADVLGNYSEAYEYYEKRYSLDSTNTEVLWRLGYYSMFQHQHDKALRYFKKCIKKKNNLDIISMLFGLHRFAWAYGQNGYQKEAEFYLNTIIKNCLQVNKLDRDLKIPRRSDYDLAAAYAFKGEKEIALRYLRIYSKVPQILLGMLNMIKDDPLFDNIRDETEFQTIVRDLEAKYHTEHERVKKWLEDQGTL